MLRTHTCGQLNLDNLEEEVTLCGWVYTRRDHGSLIFIDLKDRYGITQVVVHKKESGQEAYDITKGIKVQSVIKIKGKVRERPQGTYNEGMYTGKVEIGVEEIQVLNQSKELPFELEKDKEISEELRFKYRYLDLRRDEAFKNLELRHRVTSAIRKHLSDQGFLELETPLLTKSTPEGARDFLVPSRIMPGKFYALPQSPQLFKQIFMISGIDKYFQIARCFRDEDLRADRQPEFTQLDLECSFIDEEDIINIMESLFKYIFKETMDIDLEIPFPRMTYKEAIEKYNTDKPDLSTKDEKFKFLWVLDFPMFKYNEELKQWDLEHHPFTSPKDSDLDMLDKDKSLVKARAYDLVLDGVEIGSGSIRIHNPKLQEKIFELIGLSKKEYTEKFGFLLDALSLGAPPHGGIAFGVDRLVAIIAGCDSIRDVIPFPKTQAGVCQLTGAPTEVLPEQLLELRLKYIKNEGGDKK